MLLYIFEIFLVKKGRISIETLLIFGLFSNIFSALSFSSQRISDFKFEVYVLSLCKKSLRNKPSISKVAFISKGFSDEYIISDIRKELLSICDIFSIPVRFFSFSRILNLCIISVLL
jgi:hypothetical protein